MNTTIPFIYMGNDLSQLTPSELIRLILQEHHDYVRRESGLLVSLATKVMESHYQQHPELVEIKSIVDAIVADMDMHQMKEERILFPFIEAMEQSLENGSPVPESCFGDVRNPIRMMESDHDHVHALLERLKELTHDYALPEDACEPYVELYNRLEAFQNNTYRHVHLENDILFKKAAAMQQMI